MGQSKAQPRSNSGDPDEAKKSQHIRLYGWLSLVFMGLWYFLTLAHAHLTLVAGVKAPVTQAEKLLSNGGFVCQLLFVASFLKFAKLCAAPLLRLTGPTEVAEGIADRLGVKRPEVFAGKANPVVNRPTKTKIIIDPALVENLSPRELEFFLARELVKANFSVIDLCFLGLFIGAQVFATLIIGNWIFKDFHEALVLSLLLIEVIWSTLFLGWISKSLKQRALQADIAALKVTGDLQAATNCLRRTCRYTNRKGWEKYGSFGQPSLHLRVDGLETFSELSLRNGRHLEATH